jgi:hypothetical protein
MGQRGALNGQRIIHFSMDRGMGITSSGLVSSYVRESNQRLEEWSSIVRGCRI